MYLWVCFHFGFLLWYVFVMLLLLLRLSFVVFRFACFCVCVVGVFVLLYFVGTSRGSCFQTQKIQQKRERPNSKGSRGKSPPQNHPTKITAMQTMSK